MINLYRHSEHNKPHKNKTMFPLNKSHIASMNLKLTTETLHEPSQQHDPMQSKNSRPSQDELKNKSAHKYKKSLILQEHSLNLNYNINPNINPNINHNLNGMHALRTLELMKKGSH